MDTKMEKKSDKATHFRQSLFEYSMNKVHKTPNNNPDLKKK